MYKKRLSRTKLARLCAEYDAGAFGAANAGNGETQGAPPLSVVIKAADAIPQGAPIEVTGVAGSPNYRRALRLMNERRLILTARQATSGGTSHGFAAETIRQGKLGRAELSNAFVHSIKILSSSHRYVSPQFITAAEKGTGFNLLANSAPNQEGMALGILATGLAPTVEVSSVKMVQDVVFSVEGESVIVAAVSYRDVSGSVHVG